LKSAQKPDDDEAGDDKEEAMTNRPQQRASRAQVWNRAAWVRDVRSRKTAFDPTFECMIERHRARNESAEALSPVAQDGESDASARRSDSKKEGEHKRR